MDLVRCPACSAALRPEAPWCTLCYHDLTARPKSVVPAPAPAPAEPVVTTTDRRPTADALGASTVLASTVLAPTVPASGASVTGGCWPCLTCGAAMGLDLDRCSECGSPFLAAAAETGRHRQGSGTRGLQALAGLSHGGRMVAGIVIGALVALVLPLLIALLG